MVEVRGHGALEHLVFLMFCNASLLVGVGWEEIGFVLIDSRTEKDSVICM